MDAARMFKSITEGAFNLISALYPILKTRSCSTSLYPSSLMRSPEMTAEQVKHGRSGPTRETRESTLCT